MTFRVYVAQRLSYPEERRQMRNIVRDLLKMFASEDADCRLIIDVDPGRQIDAVLWKDEYFALVELKNYSGKIVADNTDETSTWSITQRGKTVPLGQPDFQIAKARDLFVDFLVHGVLKAERQTDKFIEGPTVADELERHVRNRVRGWVVVNDDAEITSKGVDFGNVPWYRRLHLSEVPEEALLLGTTESPLNTAVFESVVTYFNAKEVEPEDWLKSARKKTAPNRVCKIQRLDSWIAGQSASEQRTALDRIVELELVPVYQDEIRALADSSDAEIRKIALVIMINWRFPDLGDRLGEALKDESREIRTMILDYLAKTKVPETLDYLHDMLGKPDSDKLRILQALQVNGEPSSCKKILEFASKQFGRLGELDKEFENFGKKMDEAYRRTNLAASEDDNYWKERERLSRIQTDLHQLVHLFSGICKATGSLKCPESTEWLKSIVESPYNIGLAVSKVPKPHSTYSNIFTSAVEALGETGDKKATGILISKLERGSEDYADVLIRALGKIGDRSAIGAVAKRLDSQDKHIRYVAIEALGRLKAKKTFDKIAKIYLSGTSMYSIPEDALRNIDPIRFEVLLLNELKDQTVEHKSWDYFRDLYSVATERSLPLMFELLCNEETYQLAAGIIHKFWNDDRVFFKVETLTQSSNEFERAGALSILHDYYKVRLYLLEKFEKDPSVVVRTEVAAIYYFAKQKRKLLRFIHDSEKSVRDDVYTFLGGRQYGRFLVSTDREYDSIAELKVIPEGIILKYSDRIQFIKRHRINRLAIIKYGEFDAGLYFRHELDSGMERCFMMDEEPRPGYASYIADIVKEISIGERAYGDPYLTPAETDAARRCFLRFKAFMTPLYFPDFNAEKIC